MNSVSLTDQISKYLKNFFGYFLVVLGYVFSLIFFFFTIFRPQIMLEAPVRDLEAGLYESIEEKPFPLILFLIVLFITFTILLGLYELFRRKGDGWFNGLLAEFSFENSIKFSRLASCIYICTGGIIFFLRMLSYVFFPDFNRAEYLLPEEVPVISASLRDFLHPFFKAESVYSLKFLFGLLVGVLVYSFCTTIAIQFISLFRIENGHEKTASYPNKMQQRRSKVGPTTHYLNTDPVLEKNRLLSQIKTVKTRKKRSVSDKKSSANLIRDFLIDVLNGNHPTLTDHHIEILKVPGETLWIEKKRQVVLDSDHRWLELMRDLMSAANALDKNPIGFFIGIVDDTGEFVSSSLPDEAEIRQKLAAYISPPINFVLQATQYPNGTYGHIIAIRPSDRVHAFKKQFLGSKKGEVWVREGSRKTKLDENEALEHAHQKARIFTSE